MNISTVITNLRNTISRKSMLLITYECPAVKPYPKIVKEAMIGYLKTNIEELTAILNDVEESDKWQPIDTAPKNKFVLVACKSGYLGIKWVYCVAQYTEGYHDRWDDDALMDRGYKPLYWKELPVDPE